MRRLPNVYINVFDNGGTGVPEVPPGPPSPDDEVVWFFVI